MKKRSKILIFIALLFFLFLKHNVLADIIPDDGKKSDGSYQICDLIMLLKNIALFILGISGSAALLAFVVGGFYMILSAGNSDMVNKGKQAISGAVIGLAIVFFSFTVVGFILTNLGYSSSFGKWYEADCYGDAKSKNSKATYINIDGTTLNGSLSFEELAQDIVDNPNITLEGSASADCSGYSVVNTMQEIISTGKATACDINCVCNTTVNVNSEMMSDTNDISKKYPLRISSITTGKHAENSGHYQGYKIDIVPVADKSKWQDIIKEYNDKGHCARCDNAGSFVPCSQATHIDVDYSKGPNC